MGVYKICISILNLRHKSVCETKGVEGFQFGNLLLQRDENLPWADAQPGSKGKNTD